MASTSNNKPRTSPAWTSRILFRTGSARQFCWFYYPGEFDPVAAETASHRLLCEGLTVLVCTSDEYDEIGLPQTFAGDEYYRTDPDTPTPTPPREDGPVNRHDRPGALG